MSRVPIPEECVAETMGALVLNEYTKAAGIDKISCGVFVNCRLTVGVH